MNDIRNDEYTTRYEMFISGYTTLLCCSKHNPHSCGFFSGGIHQWDKKEIQLEVI